MRNTRLKQRSPHGELTSSIISALILDSRFQRPTRRAARDPPSTILVRKDRSPIPVVFQRPTRSFIQPSPQQTHRRQRTRVYADDGESSRNRTHRNSGRSRELLPGPLGQDCNTERSASKISRHAASMSILKRARTYARSASPNASW